MIFLSPDKKIFLATLKEIISPIRIIFFTSLFVLAALSVYSYKKNLELVNKAAAVNHTNVVKFELENALSNIIDVETGTRGYLLSGDSAFLKPYYISLGKLPESIRALDSLVKDNPKQVENMKKFKQLIALKLDFISSVVFSKIRITHDMLVSSREEMDDIRLHVALMKHEEERLLRSRTQSLNEAVSFAPTMNMMLAGFAILLLIFSYFKIQQELEKSGSLQNELRASNLILEKSNTELAQFAYVASHDLQEPIRKIRTFISRILDTEQHISETGKDYFRRVELSAKRMQQLIRDILSYSRVENTDNKFEPTDFNIVLQNARGQLEEFINERGAVIVSEKLPMVNAVNYQFEQLFVNLISNALKFARTDVPCVITITTETINGSALFHPGANKNLRYHCINVADNGIGFDLQYSERIFRIFHRLNTKEAYEGNGIGLSIVKKIMEGHNGIITASGEPGKGATFSFYIPV
ncbi:MAG: CHASE3 domain-containing protein [Ferruginibacter sp.]